jgi:hypothetical protein
MSKPAWWKNSVRIIKKLTTKDSWAEFERFAYSKDITDEVVFHYTVKIGDSWVVFSEMATIDSLEFVDHELVYKALSESFRLQIERFVERDKVV